MVPYGNALVQWTRGQALGMAIAMSNSLAAHSDAAVSGLLGGDAVVSVNLYIDNSTRRGDFQCMYHALSL